MYFLVLVVAPKRLRHSNERQNEFPFINKQKPNNDFDVQCKKTFSVSHSKRSERFNNRLKSQKHNSVSRAPPQSGKVSAFFSKVIPDKNDFTLTAREAT